MIYFIVDAVWPANATSILQYAFLSLESLSNGTMMMILWVVGYMYFCII